MAEPAPDQPASLQVLRYRSGDSEVHAVLGDLDPELRHGDLVAHASEALNSETFVCLAVAQDDDFVADELCFVPQGDCCEILSIRTSGWKRHHGDHRRSLVEILNTLAAAVACGKLRILDGAQVDEEAHAGELVRTFDVADPGGLALARDAVKEVMLQAGVDEITRQKTILCISEAVTNMLLHGGGHGSVTLRRPPGLLRTVVADEGSGLNFLNWIDPPTVKGQASMGYGFKIILDNLDAVGLHASQTGTTLLLDRVID
jgi:anti-sigma regulatory factor (Ser/Thr protein kinase)